MVWAVDCGVVHVGSDGWGLRPQMKVGFQGNTVQMKVGVDDVRDGLSAACIAQLHRVYEAEGDSIAEVLKRLQRTGGEIAGFDRLIKAAPWLLGKIIRITHVDIPRGTRIRARAAIKSGVGFDGGVCLGWADTKGYHMVGVRGKIGVIAKIGGDLLAGLHHGRRRVKAIVGYGNVVVELEFWLRERAASGVAGVAGQAALLVEYDGDAADELQMQALQGADVGQGAGSGGAEQRSSRWHWRARSRRRGEADLAPPG